MPRILMVSQPTSEGVAQCVLDWSQGLEERGWRVVVACPDDGHLSQWCADLGIDVTLWRSQRSPTSNVAGESAALRQIVAGVRPDIVMLHSSKAGLVGRLALRGSIPTVFVPHAWSFDAATGPAASAALVWERFAALTLTDLVLCVSAAEYQRGVRARIRARYQVTRNGVNIEELREISSRTPAREVLCASIGISPMSSLVVCLGRLAEQKGQDVLVAAWPQVSGGTRRHLVLIGDGPDADHLHTSTAGDPSVTYLGSLPRETALAWLAAADVVVVPSRWEGMALVPLEALAVGTPVIASDVTGLREAVTDAVGTLVPPDDPAALAGALTAWLRRDSRDRLAASLAALTHSEQHFSIERTVSAIHAALRDVLVRRSQAS